MPEKPEGVFVGEIREFKPANWITALVIFIIALLAGGVVWLIFTNPTIDLKPILSILGTVSGIGLAATGMDSRSDSG